MTTDAILRTEDIRITSLFPTPIITLEWPDAKYSNDELLRTILARERADVGVTHSNDGGWQSRGNFAEWCGPEGRKLIEYCKVLANEVSAVYHPQQGLVESKPTWVCTSWANVSRAGHANNAHTHPGAFWSAVYYVEDGFVDDEPKHGGELEFFDPRGAMPNMLAPNLKIRLEGCLCAGLSHRINPRKGMLVMFPSWLTHSVRRYQGDQARVSIALNLALPGYV